MKTIIALAAAAIFVNEPARPLGEFQQNPYREDLCGRESTSLQTNLDSLRDAFKAFEGIDPDFHLEDGDSGRRLIQVIATIPGIQGSNLSTRALDEGALVLWVYRPSQEDIMWAVFDQEQCMVIYGITQESVWRREVLNRS